VGIFSVFVAGFRIDHRVEDFLVASLLPNDMRTVSSENKQKAETPFFAG
jgi:hypothetical protein